MANKGVINANRMARIATMTFSMRRIGVGDPLIMP
jgi:hypothetical protein